MQVDDDIRTDLTISGFDQDDAGSARMNVRHRKLGRCGIPLQEGMWSIRNILPPWIPGHETLFTAEAICEACTVDPAFRPIMSHDHSQ